MTDVQAWRRGFSPASFDVVKVRDDFPILRELVHGKPLVYLDTANTAQKPVCVIEAMDHYFHQVSPEGRARPVDQVLPQHGPIERSHA